MNKYERLKNELELVGTGKMKAFGNSMLPILKNGSVLTFVKNENYSIGDIVFCKVKGKYIDAHKITKTDTNKGFLIANNHGFENGWTKIIYGKVIQGEFKNQIIYEKLVQTITAP
jgi:phage repressor protein C with HTH and peptisase S24 domain